jgi:hypothetical protein
LRTFKQPGEWTFAVAAHALGSNPPHLSQGSNEKRVNGLKASGCLEKAVPTEWFHHGSIKGADPLIERLKQVKAAVAWAYGRRKFKRCTVMDALRLSAHPGSC